MISDGHGNTARLKKIPGIFLLTTSLMTHRASTWAENSKLTSAELKKETELAPLHFHFQHKSKPAFHDRSQLR